MITILRSTEHKLTKIHTFKDGRIHTSDFNNAYLFEVETAEITSFDDLYEAVEIVSHCDMACIIRGRPKQQFTTPVRRTLDNFESVPTGLNWIMCDFDGIPNTVGNAPLETYTEYLISLLPQYMHEVSYVAQWSGSAGINKTAGAIDWSELKCHLWFMLKEPRTDEQAKNWAKSINQAHRKAHNQRLIDSALMNAVQIHYAANPVFIGMADHIQNRISRVDKTDDSFLMPIIEPEVEASPAVQQKTGPYTKQPFEPCFFNALAKIGSGESYHTDVYAAICSFIGSTSPQRDLQWLKQELRAAIQAGTNPSGMGKAYYMDEAHLNSEIRDAIKFTGESADYLPAVPFRTEDEKRKYYRDRKLGQAQEVADHARQFLEALREKYKGVIGK